jgi:hypothetical protein
VVARSRRRGSSDPAARRAAMVGLSEARRGDRSEQNRSLSVQNPLMLCVLFIFFRNQNQLDSVYPDLYRPAKC